MSTYSTTLALTWLARALAFCLTLSLLAGQENSGIKWEYASESDVGYFELTPLGSLLVSNKSAVTALDANTGRSIWTSRSIRDCKAKDDRFAGTVVECEIGKLGKATLTNEPASRYALFKHENFFGMIDLETGKHWLNSRAEEKSLLDVYHHNNSAILVTTPVKHEHATITAIDSGTGQHTWTATLPFTRGLTDVSEREFGKSTMGRFFLGGVPKLLGGGPGILVRDFDERVLLFRPGNALLLVGRISDEEVAIVSVDPDSGKILWVQQQIPQILDKPKGTLKELKLDSFFHAVNFTAIGDSTLIVSPAVMAPGGEPFALNTDTGKLIWKAAIKYASHSLCPECSVVRKDKPYVLHDESVSAINLRDGSLAWNVPTQAGPALRVVDAGLLVGCFDDDSGCYDTVEVRNITTGEPAWSKSATFSNRKKKKGPQLHDGATVVDDPSNRLFVTMGSQLHSVDLLSGAMTRIGEFDFQFKEMPSAIVRVPDAVVVLSSQNMAGFKLDGGLLYQRSYDAPGSGFWEMLGRGIAVQAINFASYYVAAQQAQQQAQQNAYLDALSRNSSTGSGIGTAFYSTIDPRIIHRFSASTAAFEYNYVYTSGADQSGTEGFSLVQVRYRDGEERARARVNERKPELILDSFSSMVYAKKDGKHVVAIPFLSSER